MQDNGRILKELEEFQKPQNKQENAVHATTVGDNLRHWKGTVFGPKETCYESGIFIVDIQIPSEYPFRPPKMKFDTKIWHPNISSQTGAICLDILKNEWTPALTIRTALISLQALMCTPEPDDPQDAEVAKQYKTDRKAFEITAKQWTQQYAKDPEIVHKEKVQMLMEMGIDEATAKEVLEKNGWDTDLAINQLFP